MQTIPPTPPDPSKVSYLPFCYLRFLGKLLPPQTAKNFFGFSEVVKSCFCTRCVYIQNAQMFVQNLKWAKNSKKELTPDPTSRSDLGCCEP